MFVKLDVQRFCRRGKMTEQGLNARVRDCQLSCQECGPSRWGIDGPRPRCLAIPRRKSGDMKSLRCRVECRRVLRLPVSEVVRKFHRLPTRREGVHSAIGEKHLWMVDYIQASTLELIGTTLLGPLRLAPTNSGNNTWRCSRS